jgi:hypothetical protein
VIGPHVETLDYAELRRLVAAWPLDADRAVAAHRELLARRRVVERLGWDHCREAAGYYGPATAVTSAPWLDLADEQARPRVVRWQRPTSSTLYASDEDLAREAIDREARAYWRRTTAAGVPRGE